MFGSRQQERRPGAIGRFFGALVFLVSIAFLVAPGMAIAAGVRQLAGEPRDAATMWIAAVLGSLAVFVVAWLQTSPPRKSSERPRLVGAARAYGAVCLLVVVSFLVAHYAFQLEFPARALAWYAEGEQVDAVYRWLGVERPAQLGAQR